ncbi:hypothetical protein [Listeria welshimeri]|uniref:hypothetical protein n=1 Tax=Listeria welshimeri TaxID=1643 RepID=UPI001888002C|nr:hypothetical protein [Listeria welshimeri]MBF2451944.1 hypothetical protein [Listeria welshimeri]MBF2509679.1 hypothetical protein [Listeria welshimeri]MBF2698358.1 hypothetical protein [Listeria welshimeri]
MLKAHWKLEWNAHRYIFFATYLGWIICLLIGLFFKLGKGLSEPLMLETGMDGAVFVSGDSVFTALIEIVGSSWLLIWLVLFLAAARAGVYDEKRYLFFQTKTPIRKTLINKFLVAMMETTILTAGFLVITISLAIVGGAETSLSTGLMMILETFLAIWLMTSSFICIFFIATALSMIPVGGYRFGFIAAIIYALIINEIQIQLGGNILPEIGSKIYFHYTLFLSFHVTILQAIFNLVMDILLFFIAIKILNKSADLQ